MFNLEKKAPATYVLPKHGNMLVPGLIIGNEKLLSDPEMEKPLEQVANVACLPGILGYSVAMADMHWGYGFPIGGVAAMDAETGVISPGGVGYDINCGVRLAIVPTPFDEIDQKHREKLLDLIFRYVPSGVGHGHRSKNLTDADYRNIASLGAAWSIEHGYGFSQDLDHIESMGVIKGAEINVVSEIAKRRGAQQLGSIGSGNHFIEMGNVQQIFLPEVADAWGIKEGMTYVLIHSGSRGFGHQVCQDSLDEFLSAGYAKGLPDKQLVCAPLHSDLGQKYLAAMSTAANFAFNNRQQILHYVRKAIEEVLNIPQADVRLLYDVCHNIAKMETHLIEGQEKKVCVHRKGATRAFGPGHPELNPLFKVTGQPVLVPGDMGRASHLMVGLGNPLTFCSCCHGAGRAKSRIKSLKTWGSKDLIKEMRSQGVLVKASSHRTIAEEMPDAYKEVDEVVQASHDAGLAKMVARLKPHMVVKG